MMSDIARLAQEEGVSLSQWFATAAAQRVGYETRRREDGVEVDRLRAWRPRVERRLARIERILFRPRRR